VLRARLIVGSPYLGMALTSVLRRLIADNYALTVLPVDLRANTSSMAIVTFKNRTLSPVAEPFLACVRGVAGSFAGKQGGGAARLANRSVLSPKSSESAATGTRP